MFGDDRNSEFFHNQLRRVVGELLHLLSAPDSDKDLGSLAINWKALGRLENGSEKQEEALQEALECLNPEATYASNDEQLREEIERLLSDIMDTMLSSPAATPSPNSSRSGSGNSSGSYEANEQSPGRPLADSGQTSLDMGVEGQDTAQ